MSRRRVRRGDALGGRRAGGRHRDRQGASVRDVVVEGDRATAFVCDDYRDVTASDPNGTYASQEVGLENVVVELTLGPSVGGTWIVLESNSAGAC